MFNLSLLSQYRTQLMGIAMFWVVLYHISVPISFPIAQEIKQIGFLGVEMFFFLSGMGCFFSLSKNKSIWAFYKSRLLRILPCYLPIVMIYSILLMLFNGCDFTVIIYNITTLSFWMNLHWHFRFDWYIPCLLLLYFIAPFYVRFFNKSILLCTFLILLFCFLISVLIVDHKFSYLLVLTARAPNFFVGILVGYLIKNKVMLSSIVSCVLLFLFIVGVVMLTFGSDYMLAFFLRPTEYFTIIFAFTVFLIFPIPLMMVLSKLMFISRQYCEYNLFGFLGTYSLVIYLLHERILFVLKHFFMEENFGVFINILSIPLVLILGYYYQNKIYFLVNKITND